MDSRIGSDIEDGAPLRAMMKRLGVVGPRGRRGELPNLATVHPGLRLGGRWVGLRAVPTRCIRGTASLAIAGSRGIDFRPLQGHEPSDWRSRWTRLGAAANAQVALPPVELICARGEYWVVDGHNRVALAKERGQLWIDADVTELDIVEPDIPESGQGSDKLAAAAA